MAARLPFQSPGRLLQGTGASEKLPEAQRQLYFARLMSDASGADVVRRSITMSDGTRITAGVHGPLDRVTINTTPQSDESSGEKSKPRLSRLVWMPEGFVITPRTGTATNGFGMPPTEDGIGTPGGPLKQVIINRFKDNQYPDALATKIIGPQDPSMRTFCVGALFFMDWELTDTSFGPGLWRGNKFYPQFSARWVQRYREVETSTWYCHRPQTAIDAERLVHTTIRDESNNNRAIDGKPPVNPPVRGHENGLSESICFMMVDAHVLAHNTPDYREGYRTMEARWGARYGLAGTTGVITPANSTGENLYSRFTTNSVGGARLGEDAVQWWRNSPPHNSNMVRDWGNLTKHYAVVESAARRDASGLTEKQQDGVPTETYDPPEPAIVATQIFHGMENWVIPSLVGQEGSDYAVGTQGPFYVQGHGYFPRVGMNSISSGILRVSFKGRAIEVFENSIGNGILTITAAKMVVEDGAATKLRVAGHWRPGSGSHYINVYEGDAHDFKATRVLLAQFLLPTSLGQMSIPKFSASGERMVFSYTEAVSESSVIGLGHVVAQDLQDGTFSTAVTNATRSWGEIVHFIELSGGFFSEIGSGHSIDVDVDRWVTGIHQQCEGEYPLFADYAGETVVYASAVVDFETSQSGTGGAYSETVRLHGHLRFPNGSTLQYTHTDTGPGLVVSGFFRHFLYLDIMRPERTAYMQYDVSGDETPVVKMSLYAHGQLVRQKDNVGRTNPDPLYARKDVGFTVVGGLPTLGVCHFRPFEAVNTSTGDVIRINPASKAPAAAVTHKASLIGTASFSSDAQFVGSSVYATNNCVGPSVVLGVPVSFELAGVTDFAATFYKGEYLYAGYVSNTVRAGMASGNTGWEGADQYFWHSSLPLRTITNLPLLSDNILPIGTL